MLADLDALVVRAEALLDEARKRRKRRKLYRVGQKSRRPSGEVFVKTDAGWRRQAKNPRKKSGGWLASLVTKAKELLAPTPKRLPDGRKPGEVRDGPELFRKGQRTKSPRPKRSQGSPAPKTTRWR